MTEACYVGNAATDAHVARGWLLGHFVPVDDARHADDLEIKWGVHPSGDMRAQWVTDEKRSTVVLLISGRFRVELPERSVLLAQQGDYVVFRNLSHSWRAEEDSIVLVIRWPSVAGYAALTSDIKLTTTQTGSHIDCRRDASAMATRRCSCSASEPTGKPMANRGDALT